MAVLGEMKAKKTQGRQRIEIKKLENGSNKQVTFTKRRSGLFKKAAELSILCGSDVAVLVFSPNDKLFCFGNSSVDSVVCRYAHGMNNIAATNTTTNDNITNVEEVNRDYIKAEKELVAEKSRLAEVKKKKKATICGGEGKEFWWDEGIEGMGMEELKQYVAALHEMRRMVAERVRELKATAAVNDSTSLAVAVPPTVLTTPLLGQASLGFGNGNMNF